MPLCSRLWKSLLYVWQNLFYKGQHNHWYCFFRRAAVKNGKRMLLIYLNSWTLMIWFKSYWLRPFYPLWLVSDVTFFQFIKQALTLRKWCHFIHLICCCCTSSNFPGIYPCSCFPSVSVQIQCRHSCKLQFSFTRKQIVLHNLLHFCFKLNAQLGYRINSNCS